jgi:TetR/AcrR family transcriptional repressor of nem operon
MPRPKAFDPADKLDEAMVLFWNEGFETTSIPKLEKKLKINRFSIYDTYGDKRTLFVKVLERYTGILEERFVLPLQEGSKGIADLRRFLKDMWQKFGEPEQTSGCLLINTATEIGSHDQGIAKIVNGYFERVGDALLTCSCASLMIRRK